MSIVWILLQSFHSHLQFSILSLATGKTAVHEIKRELEFTHCEGCNILYSVQLICQFSQYHQIKLHHNFNSITDGVTSCLKLNATCLLIWPFWQPYNEQFHSMNESTITSYSAWKVKWLPNRTEAGVYTLKSEQFVWTYYYQRHPLGGADSESNTSSKTESSEKINKDSMEKGRWNRDMPWIRENGWACTNEVKKKVGKCTVMEQEAVRKTNNELLTAVVEKKKMCGNVNWTKENMQVWESWAL